MRYFISQQIHGCFATLSSRDIFVSKEISRDEFIKLPSSLERMTSREFDFAVVYAEPDKTYGGIEYMRNYVSMETLRSYVWETYLEKGYQYKDPVFAELKSQYFASEEKKETERRKSQGYVIPRWSRDLPPESYQGGFSDDVFLHPELFDYVKGGGCHGYIGHSVRKPALDKYFERAFLRVNPDKSLLAMWLTSTGGRHFCDSLEGCSFKEQKEYIKEKIQSVVEQALYYRKENL